MCGRFVRRKASADYAEVFQVESVPGGPSYNIAPTQPVAVVRMMGGRRECVQLRWGLIPYWSKDGKQMFINARDDNMLQKLAFRDSASRRRCLVLADGYYEWKTEGKVKKPFLFHLRDDRPFAFAGLWDRWKGPDGPVESCAIITTDANELSRDIHDRMPVILSRPGWELWLNEHVEDADRLQELLGPYPSEEMDCYPVSPLVNNAKNDSPECIQRVA
jgi:putative SOS response-associated peptidase YedK